jgi:hypothetical protein
MEPATHCVGAVVLCAKVRYKYEVEPNERLHEVRSR